MFIHNYVNGEEHSSIKLSLRLYISQKFLSKNLGDQNTECLIMENTNFLKL